jgi:hypothetical protein
MANCPGYTTEEIDRGITLMEKHKLKEVRGFDPSGIENGLLVLSKYIMRSNCDISYYVGSVKSHAKEIHYKEDLIATSNKSVIVVGPSPHLEGRGLGPEIDKFDLIVRMNNSYTIDNIKDYGSRTDILTVNDMWYRNNSDKVPEIASQGTEVYQKHINLRVAPVKVTGLNSYSDNMGVLVLNHLINLGYKDITITGYSFYQTENFYTAAHYKEQSEMILDRVTHNQSVTIKNIIALEKNSYIKIWPDVKEYLVKAKKAKLF